MTDRSGLRTRVFWLMGVGIFIPMVIMGAVGWYWLASIEDRLSGERLASAGTAAAHFDELLTGDLEVLQRLAAAAGAFLGDGRVADVQRATHDAVEVFRHRQSIWVLDDRGAVLAESPAASSSAAPSTSLPVVADVLSRGLPRLSGLEEGPFGPVVHELVAVRGRGGQVVGVAGGSFDPRRRDFGKMLQHLRAGQTGVVDLVDGAGAVLASSDPRRAGLAVECRAQVRSWIKERRTLSMRCDRCHAERGVPERRGQLVTFVPVASAGWGLVVRQSAAEALPTEGDLPWPALLAFMCLHLAISSIFAWGAARSVTQPLAVLTHEAERIAAGELQSPIPELGEDEVGRLGEALERMRAALRENVGRVERANSELEQRVAERTLELAQANEALQEREVGRVALLRMVITAQEDERKRVARELHDETTQALAVLLMRIESARAAIRDGKAPSLDEVKAIASRILDDVHRLILDLRPSVLDDLGLASAITWYADRALGQRGVAVRCEVGELPKLPPELETTLFRLCQEALSNVAKHAQATQVLVELAEERGEIRVSIEDDGKGFDMGKVEHHDGRRHWGLVGISERAELLGGRATIDSSPGAGTRVEVVIPLQKEGA